MYLLDLIDHHKLIYITIGFVIMLACKPFRESFKAIVTIGDLVRCTLVLTFFSLGWPAFVISRMMHIRIRPKKK